MHRLKFTEHIPSEGLTQSETPALFNITAQTKLINS